MKTQPESQDVLDIATKSGDKLDEAGLDGRDVNSNCDGLKSASVSGAAVNFVNITILIFAAKFLFMHGLADSNW